VLCEPQRRDGGTGAQLESRRTAADAIRAATSGTVCVRQGWLPRYLAERVAAVRDARIQLVICGQQPPKLTELVVAPIQIPALAIRTHELDQIIDEYADESQGKRCRSRRRSRTPIATGCGRAPRRRCPRSDT